MDRRYPSTTPEPLSPWGLRAAASGIAATALGAGLGTMTYLQIPGTASMPWDRLGIAIVLFMLVAGLCVGAFVGWGTLWASRHRPSLLRLAVGGAAGGALAGILPGLFGFAGFGSLHAPYMGTLNILSCCLAGGTAFVVLWAPRLLPRSIAQRITPARRFGLAALAAVITAGSVGLLGGMLALSLQLLPTLAGVKCVVHTVGLPALGMTAGSLLGMLGGALVGLCCGIFLTLARRTADA